MKCTYPGTYMIRVPQFEKKNQNMSSSSSSTASGSPANTDARIAWLRPVQPMFGVVSDKKILKNAIFSALHQHNLGGVVQKEGANI